MTNVNFDGYDSVMLNETINKGQLIRVKDLSKLIGISAFTIRKMAREHRIPSYRPTSKFYLFDPEEVIASIKMNYQY